MLNSSPSTKQQLIQSLQRTSLEKFQVIDTVTKSDLPDLTKDLQSFIGNGSRTVSVIFLKGRT